MCPELHNGSREVSNDDRIGKERGRLGAVGGLLRAD
jgi:hypothetical protein